MDDVILVCDSSRWREVWICIAPVMFEGYRFSRVSRGIIPANLCCEKFKYSGHFVHWNWCCDHDTRFDKTM